MGHPQFAELRAQLAQLFADPGREGVVIYDPETKRRLDVANSRRPGPFLHFRTAVREDLQAAARRLGLGEPDVRTIDHPSGKLTTQVAAYQVDISDPDRGAA